MMSKARREATARGIAAMHSPKARKKARATRKRNQLLKAKGIDPHAHEAETLQLVQERLKPKPGKVRSDKGFEQSLLHALVTLINRTYIKE